MKNKQQGFSMAAVLVLVVIVIVAVAGVAVWRQQHSKGGSYHPIGPVLVKASSLPSGWTVTSTTTDTAIVSNATCQVEADRTMEDTKSFDPFLAQQQDLSDLQKKGYNATQLSSAKLPINTKTGPGKITVTKFKLSGPKTKYAEYGWYVLAQERVAFTLSCDSTDNLRAAETAVQAITVD